MIENTIIFQMQIQHFSLRCLQNHQVTQICTNLICNHNSFVCNPTNKCQCRSNHKKCEKYDWQFIKEIITKDFIKQNSHFQLFITAIQTLYQNLLQQIQKALDDFNNWRNNFGLTQSESQLLQLIKQERFSELTGARMNSFKNDFQRQSYIKMKSSKDMTQQINSIKNGLDVMITQVKKLYESIKIQKQYGHEIMKEQQISYSQMNQMNTIEFNTRKQQNNIVNLIDQDKQRSIPIQNIIPDLLNADKIKQNMLQRMQVHKQLRDIQQKLKSLKQKMQTQVISLFINFDKSIQKKFYGQFSLIEQQIPVIVKQCGMQAPIKIHSKLNSLFNKGKSLYKQFQYKIKISCLSKYFDKRIKDIHLLYRASENNFQVKHFWERCNGKKNTITLLKTEFQKIIGGYTPLPWNKNKLDYQKDSEKQSFIFSLSQQDKLHLLKNQQTKAIFNMNTFGPRFGEQDIWISDKANISPKSAAIPGVIYNSYGEKYHAHNQESFKRFSGQTNGTRFVILEWEVYELTFESY